MTPSRARNAGLICLLVSAAFILPGFEDAPARDELVEFSGRVDRVDPDWRPARRGRSLRAVRFTFERDARVFEYAMDSGDGEAVLEALEGAGINTVSVLADVKLRVFEVRIGEATVQSYDEGASTWGIGNGVRRWLGWAAAAAGVALLGYWLVKTPTTGVN